MYNTIIEKLLALQKTYIKELEDTKPVGAERREELKQEVKDIDKCVSWLQFPPEQNVLFSESSY